MKGTIAILLAMTLAPVAAVAQEWRTYSYPQPGFSIQFPADPAVQTGTVRNSTGVSLPMTRYSAARDGVTVRWSFVDYTSTNADSLNTIAQNSAVPERHGQGKRRDRRPHQSGRRTALDITAADGSRSAIAIFFFGSAPLHGGRSGSTAQ